MATKTIRKLRHEDYDRYRSRTSFVKWKKVQLNHKKTFLDGRFQRHGGPDKGSGWTDEQGINYLENAIDTGVVFNKIVRVEVDGALKYAREQGHAESVEVFQEVKEKGYDYISIDGNNSSGFITALLDNSAKIKIRLDGQNPRRFEELSEDDKETLEDDYTIEVMTLYDILIDDMCDLFRRINMQTSLNDQERRQARWTPLSKDIREMANSGTVIDMFKKLTYSEINFDKRHHEELAAQAVLKASSEGATLKKMQLDAFYENTSELDKDVLNSVKAMLEKAAKTVDEIEKPLQKKIKKGVLLTYWGFMNILAENDFEISDGTKLFGWFLKQDNNFTAQAKKIPEEEKEETSYTHWITTYTKPECYRRLTDLYNTTLLKHSEEMISNGIITNKKTYFNDGSKRLALFLQGYKDRNGEDLSMLDFYLGKLEADHMVSQKDGGKTELENIEIMRKEDNRAKGAESNEPYFQHQVAGL